MNQKEIVKVLKEAKKLAKLSEEELLEKLGQEVSKFENQFKPGDMICSDNFHNGKVMIVEEGVFRMGKFSYTCNDLMIDNQKWGAYELDSYWNKENNWRLASDKDIVNYLVRFFTPSEQTIGYDCNVQVIEDGLNIYGPGEDFLHFDKKEARALKDYLNKWIIE